MSVHTIANDRLTPDMPSEPAIDTLLGLRVMRLRVAMNALLLSLEAAGYEAADEATVDPAAWHDLAAKLGERMETCGRLLADVRGARAIEDAEKIAAMHSAFCALENVEARFRASRDKRAASVALLACVHKVKSESRVWSD